MDAFHVELRATLAVALVQSNDLRAEEVVARCQFGERDLVLSGFASVGSCDELAHSPGASVPAVVPELRP